MAYYYKIYPPLFTKYGKNNKLFINKTLVKSLHVLSKTVMNV